MPSQHTLIVDSRDRTSGSSSNGYFQLKAAHPNVSKVELVSAMIPNTIYNVQSGINDRMCWFRSGIDHSFQLTAGAYTVTSLLSALQTGMNGVDANTFVLSYSTTTLKVTVGGASAFSLNFATHPNAAAGCHRLLGFEAIDTSSATSHVAPNTPELNQPFMMYIRISGLDTQNDTTSSDPHTFVVPIAENSGGITIWNSGDFEQCVRFGSPKSIKSFNVDFRARNESALSLNGAEWIMVWRLYYAD